MLNLNSRSYFDPENVYHFDLKNLTKTTTIAIWILGVVIGYLVLIPINIDLTNSFTISIGKFNLAFIVEQSSYVLPFSTIFVLIISATILGVQEMLFTSTKKRYEEERTRQAKEIERQAKEIEYLKKLNTQIMNQSNSNGKLFDNKKLFD